MRKCCICMPANVRYYQHRKEQCQRRICEACQRWHGQMRQLRKVQLASESARQERDGHLRLSHVSRTLCWLDSQAARQCKPAKV